MEESVGKVGSPFNFLPLGDPVIDLERKGMEKRQGGGVGELEMVLK